jgi:methanogenic corrinoid protein MtbC1
MRQEIGISGMSELFQQLLLAGDRTAARGLIQRALESGSRALELLNELIWPTMERLQSMYRADRINKSQLNMATRVNRMLTDLLSSRLDRLPDNSQCVLILCGDEEPEELGGQICADLFESAGYTVRFAGGGVPHDETLKLIGECRPDLLVLFGTLPTGMPQVRKLIDYLREVNSCPNMRVMCCGGIYKRAEGLAEEIGADLFAPDASSAIEVARLNPHKRASIDQQTVGRMRRVRRAAAKKSIDTDLAEAA